MASWRKELENVGVETPVQDERHGDERIDYQIDPYSHERWGHGQAEYRYY